MYVVTYMDSNNIQMENIGFTDLINYVDIYVNEMILTDVLKSGSIPQTEDDFIEYMEMVVSSGVVGPTGVGSMSIDEFYALENNILERVTWNALDDIMDYIRMSPNSLYRRLNLNRYPDNLPRICDIFVNAYVEQNIISITQYIYAGCLAVRGQNAE
jgi:hypothetical protein